MFSFFQRSKHKPPSEIRDMCAMLLHVFAVKQHNLICMISGLKRKYLEATKMCVLVAKIMGKLDRLKNICRCCEIALCRNLMIRKDIGKWDYFARYQAINTILYECSFSLIKNSKINFKDTFSIVISDLYLCIELINLFGSVIWM